LGTMELSIAVPVANAMTFVITAVTAALIGEAGGVPRSRECCALASIARFEVPLLTLFLLLPSLQVSCLASRASFSGCTFACSTS
jgi:hypothetical protein